VTGSFGGSILGHHLDFEPRIHEVLRLKADYPLHAGIDVSDGLSRDLAHICEESKVGAILNVDSIPIAPAAYQMNDDRTPLKHALGDGEDFELVLAVPPESARELIESQPIGVQLTDIGEFTAELGLRQRDGAGAVCQLEPRGYEHRFDS
jgi:thiamine-monophosphate kinase